MSLELRVNPFLRCDDPAVRLAAEWHAGRPLNEPAAVFGALRAWKDQFR
jgi:hydroxyacylglutathione hydrolase